MMEPNTDVCNNSTDQRLIAHWKDFFDHLTDVDMTSNAPDMNDRQKARQTIQKTEGLM